MGKRVDLTGRTINEWTVINEAGRYKYGAILWMCQCSCGTVKTVLSSSLVSGTSGSCGKCSPPSHNKFIIEKDIVRGFCTNGSSFIFDIVDFEKVKKHQWFEGTKGYILTRIKRKTLRLHQLIMGNNGSDFIDHISRDVQDNRRCNLRFCNNQQNIFNKGLQTNNHTGYKGVHYNSKMKKYCAGIKAENKTQYLGLYDTALEAAAIYDVAAKKYFGEFAWLNFDHLIDNTIKKGVN